MLIFFCFICSKEDRTLLRRLLCLLLYLCCLFLSGVSLAATETDLPGPLFQFHQINVGRAQAHLIIYGDWGIMIDGGSPDEQTRETLKTYLEASGIRSLKAYIVTHWHPDHAGNLNEVLSLLGDADTLVFGPSEAPDEKKLPLSAGQYVQMKDGDVHRFGPVSLTCVGPRTVIQDGQTNEDSLNVIIRYGNRRFMITGDYVYSKWIIADHADLLSEGVDVFQFPHHGLKPFEVEPFVIIPMNVSYVLVPGFRAFVPKDRFINFGIRAKWLDNNWGNIVFLTDGESLEMTEHAAPGQFAGR